MRCRQAGGAGPGFCASSVKGVGIGEWCGERQASKPLEQLLARPSIWVHFQCRVWTAHHTPFHPPRPTPIPHSIPLPRLLPGPRTHPCPALSAVGCTKLLKPGIPPSLNWQSVSSIPTHPCPALSGVGCTKQRPPTLTATNWGGTSSSSPCSFRAASRKSASDVVWTWGLRRFDECV